MYSGHGDHSEVGELVAGQRRTGKAEEAVIRRGNLGRRLVISS